MSARSQISSTLRATLGPERTVRLRRAETKFREQLADKVAPPRAPIGTPAAKKPTGAKPSAQQGAAKPAAATPARPRTRQQTIDAIGAACEEGLGSNSSLPKGVTWLSPDAFADYEKSGMTRHSLLIALHELMQPQTYFEIGIDQGQSMALSRCLSIGVDPGFRITRELHCDLQTFRLPSDDFFAGSGDFDHLGGKPVELAFIDGMHLAEFLLRDFMNTEKHMAPGGVVILDDMLPRNSLEAYRIRRTSAWAGDVYKVHDILRQYRPDLTLLPLNTDPTGSYMVLNLDPTSTVLDEALPALEAQVKSPDPQTVDDDWLNRIGAYNPKSIIDSPIWSRWRTLRDAGADRAAFAPLWQELADGAKI